MSAAVQKPPVLSPTSRSSSVKPSSPSVLNRSPSRASTPTTTGNGISRTRSLRGPNTAALSARASAKRATGVSGSGEDAPKMSALLTDGDARAEAAALMEDLKERLQRAEQASEEYQRQVKVLQSRLDDAHREQGKLEDRAHGEEERAAELQNEKKDLMRQRRELEGVYETERVAATKEKEDAHMREEELQRIIQRLKDDLAQRDSRPGLGADGRLSRTSSFRSNSPLSLESGHLAPSSLQRSDSRGNSALLLQKDKLIESLRLELAEHQIKLVEMENLGDGHLRELEKALLETRMTNARLMEDNDSFQLLLSEKTLNGEFSRGAFMRPSSALEERAPSRTGPSTSLADELSSVAESDSETRRLESEVNSLKDQNKALTLYVNKIIDRVLQHQGFETILSNHPESASRPEAHRRDIDKDLPPAPAKENLAPSFLQRTKSVVLGANRARPRPVSMVPPHSSSATPTAATVSGNADPPTAPPMPLQRSQSSRTNISNYTHRRANSEWSNATASNMYRNPQPEATPPPGPPRTSFFGANAAAMARIPSSGPGSLVSYPASVGSDGSEEHKRFSGGPLDSASNSDGSVVTDAPSPPRSLASSGERAGGAVMAGNRVKPLRLVQEAEEESVARKKANRASWWGGWLGKGQEGVVQ